MWFATAWTRNSTNCDTSPIAVRTISYRYSNGRQNRQASVHWRLAITMCLAIIWRCAIPIKTRYPRNGFASRRWLRPNAISLRNWRSTKRRFLGRRIRSCRWRQSCSTTWFLPCRSLFRRYRSTRISSPALTVCLLFRRLPRRISISVLSSILQRSSTSSRVVILSSNRNCHWENVTCLMISCLTTNGSRSSSSQVLIWQVSQPCCDRRLWLCYLPR